MLLAGTMAPALLAAQPDKSKTIIIEGKIVGDRGGADKMYVWTGHDHMDSVVIRDGRYSITLPFREPGFISMAPEYIMRNREGYRPYGVLVDKPGKYWIESDVAKPFIGSDVGGDAVAEAYGEYTHGENALNEKMRVVVKQRGLPDTAEKEIGNLYDSLSKEWIVPYMENFIKAHRDNLASAFILQGWARMLLDLDQQQAMYAVLTPAIQASDPAVKLRHHIEGKRRSAVGQLVADFSLPDTTGKMISFSSLKGKYRLIDLWASWCGPCRESFPHMREVYKAMKGPRFEMISISIDKSRPSWLKAVGEEKNTWVQVLDTEDVAASHFGVTVIPTLFLVDPEGRIIAREEGFEEGGNGVIEKKLKELRL